MIESVENPSRNVARAREFFGALPGGKVIRQTLSFHGGRRLHGPEPAGRELAIWSDRAR
jgi:hypothetical protein